MIDLIFFFVFVKMGLYYFLPTLMRIASNYKFEREDNVSIPILVLLYLIEMISWSVWFTVLLSVLSVVTKSKKRIELNDFFYYKYLESKTLLFILASGFITFYAFGILGIYLGLFSEVFKSLFGYTGLAVGPLLMMLSLRYYNNPLFFLGVGSTLLSIFSSSNNRGTIVYLVIFMLFVSWFMLRDKWSKIITCSTLCALMVMYFALGGLFDRSIFIDESGRVAVNIAADPEKKGALSALDEIEWRFGASTRIGTAFIGLYDRGEAAGINPIKHSLMGFLPRSINPNKPVPSTLVADDIFSMGMYIIYREIYGYDTYNMVEFPTGAHFYWEFGMPGVIVLSAVSGLYIALCAYFFSKLGMVALPLIVSVFKPWGFVDPKIWVSDIAMQLYQIILPLMLLIFIIRAFRYASKGIRQFLYLSVDTHSKINR
ncbi:TPA: hypothetical protein HA242_01655 [Candidatus Woesearchaeota archaeon]|nr:hypothetical protein [Candidatus Woesearchaeota archaeon]